MLIKPVHMQVSNMKLLIFKYCSCMLAFWNTCKHTYLWRPMVYIALLCWLVLCREAVSHSQTAFIYTALASVEVVCLATRDSGSCLLGSAALPVNKTILNFIQNENGTVSMHKKEGNLCCHLAFITSLYRFLFELLARYAWVILLWRLVYIVTLLC